MKRRVRTSMPGRRAARGFTIVEVLVALVVMAVGMLGIAGLYVIALRSGSSSINRMQAVNLAADLGDRIRANRTAVLSYAGAPAATDCATRDCTPAEIAGNDLAIWQQQLATTLPAGAGVVAVNNAAQPATYTITVSWTEPGQAAALTYTLVLQV